MIRSRERYQAAKAAFLEARELAAPDREAFLARMGGEEPELRRDVERLLASDCAGTEAPPDTATGASLGTGLSESAALPASIGPYRILGLLGAGGMGIVYRAEQPNPRRTVALKVIRPGLLTGKSLRRFEHEAQILARLAHPGIAQILEAGCSEIGGVPQAYLAMEHIEGLPITRFADRAALDTRERVALLIQVCEAVEHAHQKGVIHRDLKPDNILVQDAGAPAGTRGGVTINGANPPGASDARCGSSSARPKILDFGVARVIDSDVRLTTVHTDAGVLVGSLPYMSPEQATGDPAQVDTRSDVYSLGVLAFELLTGRLPHDVEGKSLPEVLRVIRETAPRRLSSISRALHGDLDTIVAKALESDKQRRYASVSALAADLERFLRTEPILARPASVAYQLRKLVARHRTVFALVALLLLSLMTTAVVATVQAVRIASERDDAVAARKAADALREIAESGQAREAALRRAADASREAAQTAQRRESRARRGSEKLVDFLVGIFEGADPELVGTRQFTPRELVDRGARRIETELDGQPLVRARVMDALGVVYNSLGDRDKARQYIGRALDIRENEHEPDDLQIASSLVHLAGVTSGPEALSHARRALDIRKRRLAHDDPLLMEAQGDYATQLHYAGRTEEAIEETRKALAISVRVYGGRHAQSAQWMANIAGMLRAVGRSQEAATELVEALAYRRDSTGRDLRCASMLNLLAHCEFDLGRLREAEGHAREALTIRRERVGDDHPAVARDMEDLGHILNACGDAAAAEAQFRQALTLLRARFAPGHPAFSSPLNKLGDLLREQGRFDEAEPLMREALSVRIAAKETPLFDLAESFNNLGVLLWQRSKHQEAESMLRQAIDAWQAAPGDQRGWIAQAHNALGLVLAELGRDEEGLASLYRALDALTELNGADHPSLAPILNNIGTVFWNRAEYGAAEAAYERALHMWRGQQPRPFANIGTALSNIARVRQDIGDFERAAGLYADALRYATRAAGDDHFSVALIRAHLAELMADWGDPETGVELACAALPVQLAQLGEHHPHVRLTLRSLALARAAAGDPTGAATLLAQVLELGARDAPGSGRERAASLLELALVHRREGRLEEARDLLHEAHAIASTLPLDAHPLLGRVQAALGGVMMETGNPVEGEALLRNGIEVLAACQPDHPRTQTQRAWLSGLAAHAGRQIDPAPGRAN